MENRQTLIETWKDFLDFLRWEWQVTSKDDGRFDFRVVIPRSLSKCDTDQVLGVWVEDVTTHKEAERELCRNVGNPYSVEPSQITPAVFGNSPEATAWCFSPGVDGYGRYSLQSFGDYRELWNAAAVEPTVERLAA